jgi:AraC family transcriptional regulator
MSYLRQVGRGVDFIEEHLEDDRVTCAAVARHAGVSTWHFQRIFRSLANETLGGYIRGRRLTRALDSLLRPGVRIIDVALAAGFESQANFTRAFRAAFGMTPSEYRARSDRFEIVRKARIDDAYLRHLRVNVSLEPTVQRVPRRHFVGLRTSFYGIDSDKSNMGEKLPALWDAFLRRMSEVVRLTPGVAYGIVRPRRRSDLLEYYACVEVDRDARVPPEMSSIALPPATYAVFAHRGLPRDLNATVSYVYGSWLVRGGYRHTYGADVETYGHDYRADSNESIIRYAIPIRRVGRVVSARSRARARATL